MKREIKFRVWNGRQMEYKILAGFLGAFYVQGIDEKDSASLSTFNTKYPYHIPLMQYIGLVDSNYKEIYEDDIIKTAGYIGFVRYEPQCAQYHIVWKLNGRSRYMPFNVNFSDGEIWKCDYMEVIGNIHENPELLTNQ
jgi:uncharacterized phage protein (TIGR01671 family)